MDEHTAGIDELNLVGGRLCLDFANTIGSHDTDHPDEHLTTYHDLLVWSRRAGVLAKGDQEQLAREAAARPAEAAVIFEQARELREVIYRIFAAVAGGRPVAPADIKQFNARLQEALAHAELVQGGEGFEWGWELADGALEQIVWPIIRSAADLLTAGELSRVRECSGESCGWLFVDTSRNRSRRWCDMEDCGNRAKARRHYQRKRATDQQEA
ncbi:MAG: ABATE domain-containing protein [Herpetosiphonaceae bacterium]|nr:ABATE domain-containing protein [Herpetosiphonaceae bacterium]